SGRHGRTVCGREVRYRCRQNCARRTGGRRAARHLSHSVSRPGCPLSEAHGWRAMRVQDLETPALLADLDLMEGNLQRMAAFFRGVPAKLRPHFKNHKCPDLAWRQLEAGAIGITCATLHEAECLVHHGVRSVLLANEIVDPAKIRRFADLAR